MGHSSKLREISIDSGGRPAANASSVTPSSDVGAPTQTFSLAFVKTQVKYVKFKKAIFNYFGMNESSITVCCNSVREHGDFWNDDISQGNMF